jgi:hypothetical protein
MTSFFSPVLIHPEFFSASHPPSTFAARFIFRLAPVLARAIFMTTRISIADDADAWCRRLGNFAPIVYRPALAPAAPMRAAAFPFEAGDIAARVPPLARRQRGAGSAQFLLAALVVIAMIWPLSVAAQMPGGGMGGRGGHGGGRGSHGAEASAKNPEAAVAHASNPLRAMLEEIRKLRADLLLTAEQIGPWSAMEDALRECVELGRPHPPAVQTGAPIDVPAYVQDLADHQRERADAEARLAAAIPAAFAVLNPRQLQTSKERLANAIEGERSTTASAP